MSKYNFDDYISKEILNIPLVNKIFKNIHPNVITIIGLISILILNHIYLNDKLSIYKNKQNLAILLFIKYITDILDGNVARKYKKTSKIGNFLDTLVDNSFGFFIVVMVLNKINIPKEFYIYLFIIYMIYMYIGNFNENHEFVKKDNLLGFIICNSYIGYLISYYVIIYT